MHDLPGRDGQVAADLEGAGVDLRGHATVVTDVVGQVSGARDQALPAGLGGLGHCVGVGEQVVGRGDRFGEEGHGEVGAVAALPVELHLVDETVGGVPLDEVGLHEAAECSPARPGRRNDGRPWAARRRCGRRRHVYEVAEGAEPVAAAPGSTAALRDPCQRGGDLAAGQSDERVRAQDRRIVTVEGCRSGHVRGLRCVDERNGLAGRGWLALTVSVITLSVATSFVVTYAMSARTRALLLETVPVGVIATQRRDGRARQSTVYFVLDGDTIWISTEAARAKAVDVGRTGWASLCVSPAAPYASVTVEGRATIQESNVALMTSRILARISGGEAPN